jgi:hypothetical protein
MSNTQESGVADILDMFNTDEAPDNKTVLDEMGRMAEELATLNAKIKDLEELKSRADEIKDKLGRMMFENNCANGHKFDNGIFPKPSKATQYYKKTDDDIVLKWFLDNELGDPRAIHFQKMQGLVKAHIELGNTIPDTLFTSSVKYTVKLSGNGHIKWLERQNP